MALVPAMLWARAKTALAAALAAPALKRARDETWERWLPVSRKLDLRMPPRRTNRMARFAHHVLRADLPRPARYLEIGTFEGATLALVHALLQGNLAATVIDPWLNYAELTEARMTNARARFEANMRAVGADRALRILQGRSIDHLPRLIDAGERFDMILVDGSHDAIDVLADAALAWPLLAPGGLLVFDDYLYDVTHAGRRFRPKPAIDAFVATMRQQIEILDVAGQAILRRRR